MNADERWHELIALYQTGQMGDVEFRELEVLLKESPQARSRFHRACRMDSRLRREAENADDPRAVRPQESHSAIQARRWNRSGWFASGLAAAAMVSVGLFVWGQVARPAIVATLVSGENASWESSLPTTPGSMLTPGYLKLNTGIATIQFKSGAEVILEAPAHLVLETSMRGKLLAGSAVIDVPESALGFVMETPEGFAVDYGTQFAVSVNGATQSSNFEVLKGEIAVHHPATGKEMRLTDRQGASITGGALVSRTGEQEEPVFTKPRKRFRVSTKGKATYVIRNEKRGKHLHPDFLMVKTTDSANWDMRSLLHFDLSGLDLESMNSVVVRLNQVPSGLGLAARLPVMSRFAIYGLPAVKVDDWLAEPRWEDAQVEDVGVKLGTFELPRSQQTGMIEVGSDELMPFLKADPDGSITLVIARETGLIDGAGKGLFHAFASGSHPEAAGPALVFEPIQQN